MATLTVNATLGANSVDNTQLDDMAQGTLKGRAAGGGTGDPQDLTADQVSTILDAATDPFVRTSDAPTGDVVGPAGSTNNNVPQWDGTTGKLLKDGLAVSQGGNGTADSQKLAQYTSTGKFQAGVTNGDGIQGISVNDDGVHGTSQFGSALYGNVTGAGAVGMRITHAGGSGEFIRCWNGGANNDFVVDYNGGISWPDGGTGPQTTATNLPAFGSSTKGVVPASGGGTTNFLRADGSWAAPPSGGITDGSALSIGLEFPQAGLKIYDQNGDHTMVIVPDENFTANRQLSVRLDDANRLLTIKADATIQGVNTGDQDLSGLQPLDSDLTAIAALTPANDDIIQRKAGAWTNRTIAQLAADIFSTVGNAIRSLATPAATSWIRVNTDGTVTARTAAETRTDLGLGTLATQSGTFSGTSSGTNTGDQTITLTGDVTGSGTGSFAATIANDAVTYAKIQNVSATDRILGRQSSGAGNVEEITCTAAGRALLDDADANAQRETLGLIRRKITTATTGVSTSYTDITDLSFPVVAGTTYTFIATVLAECSNVGGGICLTCNGPAATWFAARYEGNQTAGNVVRSDIAAYDTMGTLGDPTTVTAANTPCVFMLQGVIVPSANGTFTLRVKRGGGSGNVAVRAGTLEATAM